MRTCRSATDGWIHLRGRVNLWFVLIKTSGEKSIVASEYGENSDFFASSERLGLRPAFQIDNYLLSS
jgi:hypothetical protein